MNNINEALRSVHVRWDAMDETDYFNRNERKDEVVDVGRWVYVEQWSSIARHIPAVRENYPIKPFLPPRR